MLLDRIGYMFDYRANNVLSFKITTPQRASLSIYGQEIADMSNKPDISLTFAKGLKVLKAFDLSASDMSISEVAHKTSMDRASARRLILTLEHLGYVKKRGKQFRLTPKVLALSSGFLQSRQITKSIVPVLNQYSAELDTPIYLAMRDETEVIYLAHAALNNDAISLGLTQGSRVPLLSTGIGRALLMVTAHKVVQDLMQTVPLVAYTPQTIMSRKKISELISLHMQQGYAYSDSEFEAGVVGIAMPFLSDDPFPAAIGVSCEKEIVDEAYKVKAIRTLRACRNHLDDLIKML